jgi:hypothetical protein
MITPSPLPQAVGTMPNNVELRLSAFESPRVAAMRDLHTEQLELFARKNRDYGESFAQLGVAGVLVRLSDKLHRGIKVSNSGINLVYSKSLRDTLLDAANYATMAMMLLDERAGQCVDSSFV